MDVVVEGKVFIFVLSQKFEGVVISEILELDEALFGVLVCHGSHELVDQFFVFFARDAFLLQAWVHWVIQQGLVICADVNLHFYQYYVIRLKKLFYYVISENAHQN